MSGLLSDWSFETGGVWTESGLASRVSSPVSHGLWAEQLRSRRGFGESDSVIVSENLSLRPSKQYTIQYAVNADLVTEADCYLQVATDVEGGAVTVLKAWAASQLPAGWSTQSTSFIAEGSLPYRIRFRSTLFAALLGNERWHVDAVLLETPTVVITTTLRDALKDDLGDVATPTFEITLRKVYSEPVATDKLIYPSAALIPFEGGTSETDQLTNREGLAEQLFTVRAAVKSRTPFADLMKVLDSIRNAVERSTSNLYGVSQVEQVDVVSWEPVLTSDEVANQVRIIDIDVRVRYHWERGSA